MKYLYTYQLSFFFISALCLAYTKIVSMEENILYKPLFNEHLVEKHGSPFAKEYKKKVIENHGLTEKPNGFFQAYIAHSTTVDPDKKNDYLLYKTIKYALKARNEILIASITNYSNTVFNSFSKICNLISFFKTNSNQYPFTPHIRFNILFYLALLQDMAHQRPCYYPLDQALYANIYDIIPDPTNIMPKDIEDLDKSFNVFINTLKDEKNGINKIEIDKLKAFYNKNDMLILPISNKNGFIDINTFLYFLPKQFILVGAGNIPSSAHAEQLTCLTDLVIHDLVHSYISLIANKHNIINNQLSEPYNTLRERFLSIVENIINKTNTCYKNALSANNSEQVFLMEQYQFILFIILHETIYLYQFYEPNIQKAFFKDALNALFNINDFKQLKPNNYTNKAITQYFLFNSLDMLNAACYFNPRVKKRIDELGLCISPTKIERNNVVISNEELKKIIQTFVIKTLCTIFNNFFHDELYNDILDKTIFPFKI